VGVHEETYSCKWRSIVKDIRLSPFLHRKFVRLLKSIAGTPELYNAFFFYRKVGKCSRGKFRSRSRHERDWMQRKGSLVVDSSIDADSAVVLS
jgi:hypothetical protein